MGYNTQNISEEATGKWKGILPHFGIASGHLTGKQGPCPICGGRDRFRFDNKEGRGTFFCNQCGAGNGFELVKLRTGLQFPEIATRVAELVGITRREQVRADDPNWIRRARNDIWTKAGPVKPDNPAGLYLQRRCALTTFPSALRFNAGCWHSQERAAFPALVAMLRDPAGKPSSLHRTFLTKTGEKADVNPVKQLAPGAVVRGSSVRLGDPAPIMGIAEGIETALSAAALFEVPVWAAIGSALFEQWQPPAEAREVLVFVDNDVSFRGHEFAAHLARRLHKDGFKVQWQIPPEPGQDWNDVHQAQRGVS